MALTREKVARKAGEGDDLSGKDMSRLDLSGIVFSQCDVSDANLAGSNLRQVKAMQCEFNRANLAGACLDGASFSQCEFEDANLGGVTAQGAVFQQCSFSAGVRRTLQGATFKQCDFGGDDDSDGGAATAADGGMQAPGPPSPWKQYFRGFDSWPDEQRYPAMEALLGTVGQTLQAPQVFRRPNDRKVELRGVHSGSPVRVELDCGGDAMFTLQTRLREHCVLSLSFEPSFVPEPHVAAFAPGDTVRVFVGKGVFLQGHAGLMTASGTPYVAPGNIDQMTALFARLAPDAATEIASLMVTENVAWMNVGPASAEASPRSELQQMYDPPTSIGRILHLMTRCAGALHAATAYDPVQIPAASLVQVSQRCRYCNAIHVLARDMRCQNCGAPA